MEPSESSSHGVLSPAPSQPESRSKALSHATDAAPGICRICRGEGTATEPLFYPCKCSGSIKYVHQDCLMEWLSHSQKKYCELCKMPFRFTKLYAPDMPKTLPAHVFLEHMARYTVRNLLSWLRIAVALSVWTFWLPYFQRCVWSFMFWLSDGGVGAGPPTSDLRTAENELQSLACASPLGVCPASPLLAAHGTSPAQAAMMPGGMSTVQITEVLVRFLLGSYGMTLRFSHSDNNGLQFNSSLAYVDTDTNWFFTETPSLLGSIAFLRHLTRSPQLNRAVVDVLEGQAITILVIVSFILVILVRDYVVQQQPELNLRAAFDAAEHQLNPEALGHPHAAAPAELAAHQAEADSDDETLDDQGQPTRPTATEDQAQETSDSWTEQDSLRDSSRELENTRILMSSLSSGYDISNRSGIEAMASNSADDESNLGHYLQLYRRAGGDRERILEIVEAEGLEDKLHHWVDVAQQTITAKEDIGRKFADLLTSKSAAASYASRHLPARGNVESDNGPQQLDASASALTAPAMSDDSSHSGSREKHKQVWPPIPQVSPSQPRQRSSSHGPRLQASPSPSDDDVRLGSEYLFPDFANNSSTADEDSTMTLGPQDALLPVEDAHGEATPEMQVAGEGDLQVEQPQEAAIVDAAPSSGAIDEASANRQQTGLTGRIADFMWGNLDENQNANADDNQEVDEEDLWVDVPMGEDLEGDDADGENGGRGARNAEALEEMEDLEDFDGAMELIGVRGPLIGLFQNAIFCSILVSVTVFGCVFVPYNLGRIALVIAADPLQLLRVLLEFSKMAQDAAIMIGALVSWCFLNLVDIVTSILGGALGAKVVVARRASWMMWTGAGNRIWDFALITLPMSSSDLQSFSVLSHEALVAVKSALAAGVGSLYYNVASIPSRDFHIADGKLLSIMSGFMTSLAAYIQMAFSLLIDPKSWVIDLSNRMEPRPSTTADVAWSNSDRFWAILAGYLTISAIGALYLRRGTPFSRNNLLHAWEAGIIDTLQQASGIIKVILVISIEMLVFPLYCGILLDIALLPIFENATIKSRLVFTYNFPLTSAFVHWFAGTGYMFHFALFVAMCRKIVRPGVLYFIRDPDDPEFHPVRDVLERSLAAQLKKILFSALIYGALVTVGLGGVVWTLSYTMPGILPIHYSSNEPVLEFPVDLLFYNFLMPLAVRILKPNDRLHTTYTWWFRKCARCLRLTHFLFGERRIDEEGTLQLASGAASKWPSAFTWLQLTERNKVVRMTWRDVAKAISADPNSLPPVGGEAMMRQRKKALVKTRQLVKSGRFVRAPATDRVRIPKGRHVFLEVWETGQHKHERPENDFYMTDQFKLVYVPPSFRTRIFLLILSIWLFAGITGIGITVVPLVFGRVFFKALIPSHVRTNDIYAFSIGIYILGTLVFSALRIQRIASAVRSRAQAAWNNMTASGLAGRVASEFVRAVKIAYAYFSVIVVVPLVLSLIIELYLAIPLDTYMNPPATLASEATTEGRSSVIGPQKAIGSASHSILLIQAWTLGVLYLNLGCKMILSLAPESRMAIALRSVLRHGFLRPDVGVLTRAFIIPATAVAIIAAFGPPLLVRMALALGSLFGPESIPSSTVLLYRYSYPAAALFGLVAQGVIGLGGILRGWKTRIRDEAYLIGERLHNFGAATAGSRTAKKAWGAGRPRV
ncbi:hypothetical protein CDD81_243 [Ophiocordyceps australis]|uniref:RING-type E3 ubiquitin transferase n=1 Tax=Ophiocordyceps australis TaxID=1399860 RepID=A0A2C5YFC2_9HYPO|nr:hypothetical protein CDD81_243 [Ophiocordyceps australis]